MIEKIIGLNNIDLLGLSTEKMDYVIMGGAACIAHGMDITNEDVDLLVKPEVVIYHSFGNLDIGTGCFACGLTSDFIFETSVVIGGYRFMGLRTLYQFYQMLFLISGKEKYIPKMLWLSKKLYS